MTRIERILPTLVLASTALWWSQPALACIHGESDDPSPPIYSGLEIGLYFRDGREVLAYSPLILDAGDSASLAMVTATPSRPDSFATGSSQMFRNFREFVVGPRAPADASAGGDAGFGDDTSDGGLIVDPPVAVGPYEVTVLEATGDAGRVALAAWLLDNGYAPIEDRVVQAYIDEGWFFIATRVTGDQSSLGDGTLPPLMLEFATENPVVPLRLESGMPSFDLNIYAVTEPGVVDAEVLREFGATIAFQRTANNESDRSSWYCDFTSMNADQRSDCLNTASPGDVVATWIVGDGPLNTISNPISGWTREFTLNDVNGDGSGTEDDVGGDTDNVDGSGTDGDDGGDTNEGAGGCAAAPGGSVLWCAALAVAAGAVRRRRPVVVTG